MVARTLKGIVAVICRRLDTHTGVSLNNNRSEPYDPRSKLRECALRGSMQVAAYVFAAQTSSLGGPATPDKASTQMPNVLARRAKLLHHLPHTKARAQQVLLLVLQHSS